MQNNVIVDATNKQLPIIQTKNEFTIVGSALRKYRINDSTMSVTVAVKRPGDKIVNYPQIIFYGKDAVNAIDNVDISKTTKPRVKITGMVQTRKKVREGGQTDYYQSFIGRTLELTQTNMETLTGIANVGRRKAQGQNEFVLAGRVAHVYAVSDRKNPSRNVCVLLTIVTRDGGGVNFPSVVCFGSNTTIAARLKEDDYVCATCYVSTKATKNADGKYTYRESIIADELYQMDIHDSNLENVI